MGVVAGTNKGRRGDREPQNGARSTVFGEATGDVREEAGGCVEMLS